MTVMVAICTEEGAVLASDSAVTITDGSGCVSHVYGGAQKIFEISSNPPVAIVGYGPVSAPPKISQRALIGDLQRRAKRLKSPEKIAREAAKLFRSPYAELLSGHPDLETGFMVLGYARRGPRRCELYELTFTSHGTAKLERLELEDHVLVYRDSTDALHRLLEGYDPDLPEITTRVLGLTEEDLRRAAHAAQELQVPLAQHLMPLPQAQSLARYLVETAAAFSRFSAGPSEVAGPPQMLILSPDEGLI